MAVNMPVQGTAADVMKQAMLEVAAALQDRELAARMILQVHDELIFELPERETPEVVELLQEIMPTAIEMVVPLKIEVKHGPNWRDMDPYGGAQLPRSAAPAPAKKTKKEPARASSSAKAAKTAEAGPRGARKSAKR